MTTEGGDVPGRVWSDVPEKAAGFERRECYLELYDAL